MTLEGINEDPMRIIANYANPKWRISNLYHITNKAKKRVIFRPNVIQQKLHEFDGRYTMALKARQIGISTYYVLKYLDIAAWNTNINVCIQSHDRESIEKLFRIAKYAYNKMDPAIAPRLDRGGGSKYAMYFPEVNSRMYVSLEARSDTISHLHVSEYGLMKNKDRFNASIDAVPIDTGTISIESTPKGLNHFYEDWNNDEFPFKKFFFPWYFNPEYKVSSYYEGKVSASLTDDETKLKQKAHKLYGIKITHDQIRFRRHQIKVKGKSSFLEEYPEDDQTCFLTSGNPVMDMELIKSFILDAPNPITDHEWMKIYEHYNRSEMYVCGCDTAEGVGSDYSVATIFKVSSREQVAQIRGHWKPSDFAHHVDELCTRYHTGGRMKPLLAVERNNHGHAVLLELNEHIDYPNLYMHKDGRPGWVTDRVSRPIMIDTFVDGVENQTIKLNDKHTLNECMTLVDNGGKIEAMGSKYDDCVIAGAIGIQMCIEMGVSDVYTNLESKILL